MYTTSMSLRVLVGIVAACCCSLTVVSGIPAASSDPEKSDAALKYLIDYGYMNPPASEGADLLTITDVRSSIQRMQRFANLPQTGEVDAETLRVMKMPRCGVPDPNGRGTNGTVLGGRLKRYAHTGGKWPKKDLTFRVLNSPQELSFSEVVATMREAFKLWSDVVPLRFFEVTAGYADIYISFGTYSHGDLFAFDGPGGTLAHAYPPMSGFDDLDGDVHFDDSETFTSSGYDGINLLIVATHEIGHSLGLAHSEVQGALMQPFYSGYTPDFRLSYDDILGMQLIYGSKQTSPPNPDPRPTYSPDVTERPATTVKRQNKDTCNKAFQAVAYVRGEIFGFRGARYWRIPRVGQLVSPQEGDRVKYFWQGLPTRIDAGYERWHDQKSLFFKGDQYWQFDGITLEPGYPQYISDLSPDLPVDIDAVMTWKEYSKTYFFKGDLVWRFDEVSKTVDANWPYPIEEIFPGVPSNLGSAFRFRDGNGYFIRGRKYWMFNDTAGEVSKGFPRYFGVDFLDCNLQEILQDEANEGANGAVGRGVAAATVTALGLIMTVLVRL
ncbi:matrix metalloproteinase-19-like [Asterias amurensis]|uniref:matrix metalloproteinase-19-like n=1 Tax=Asterias amurensis TaxID=7602 RepID=UPI003AB59AB0